MNTIYRFQQVLKENRIELRFLAISTKGISSKKKKKGRGVGIRGSWESGMERGEIKMMGTILVFCLVTKTLRFDCFYI